MKRIFAALFFWGIGFQLHSQRCQSFTYLQEQVTKNEMLGVNNRNIEAFIQRNSANDLASRGQETVIKIPVVVHILYHSSEERISDADVISQIEALNKCFRRQNADSVNTPDRFRHLAADTKIEFQLATSDMRRRYTSGIIRKYTPITKWSMDDKMKFSSSMGDDAWDADNYLNIWVCRLDRLAGYASFPGGDKKLDGLVIDFGAFGSINTSSGYDQGKTVVHETGHWLGLKHLWGDTYCGDDGVEDTPKQASYTIGCPSSIRITCGNGPNGDMYMNYMDFTNDACMNMFTTGQRDRMRALFLPGGSKASFLTSKGLLQPLIFEIPVEESDPKWLHPQLYPNPANDALTLDLRYDPRWIGKTVQIFNLSGHLVQQFNITSKIQQVNIKNISSGVYFIAAKGEDGLSMKMKFVKL